MLANINKSLDNETKVLRDPVHEYIKIEEEVIWNLIDTKEFQRLKRIRQLGGTYQVYHGAEHSRFSHSLGVYEITRRLINEVKGLKEALSEEESLAVLCAALLHDVGHGPFSHAFESVTNVNHEKMSVKIITGKTQINEVLSRLNDNFPVIVSSIINHTHPNKLLTQLMSAQLDADRMDYLLRDAYFTGVSYGKFDLERIIRTLRVFNNQLAVKESGLNAVEDYIMARYQMYWQVYFHPVSRAFEMMLTHFFRAIKETYQEDASFIEEMTPYFAPFVSEQEVSVQDHLFLDEPTCYHGFKVLATQDKHPILKDLSIRLLNRDLFKYVDYDESTYQDIKNYLIKNNFNLEYYLARDNMKQRPYIPYSLKNSDNNINILLKDDVIKEITKVSSIVGAMAEAELKEDPKIFFVCGDYHEFQK